jgi:hypothetical protein
LLQIIGFGSSKRLLATTTVSHHISAVDTRQKKNPAVTATQRHVKPTKRWVAKVMFYPSGQRSSDRVRILKGLEIDLGRKIAQSPYVAVLVARLKLVQLRKISGKNDPGKI